MSRSEQTREHSPWRSSQHTAGHRCHSHWSWSAGDIWGWHHACCPCQTLDRLLRQLYAHSIQSGCIWKPSMITMMSIHMSVWYGKLHLDSSRWTKQNTMAHMRKTYSRKVRTTPDLPSPDSESNMSIHGLQYRSPQHESTSWWVALRKHQLQDQLTVGQCMCQILGLFFEIVIVLTWVQL